MVNLKAAQSTYKKSIYDRVKKLVESYEWSDCTFSVADQKFKAHKLILGISSPVFEAMFYGPLATEDDIQITDIHPDIFQLILNYIYTDTVEISSIEHAFELLYASRKYILEHLTEMCITHIIDNTSVDNVVEMLNYPDYLQDKQLISYSLKLFCQHAVYILQEKKNSITQPCLKAFLECDRMNISEKNLILHVFEWTIHYCEQNNILDLFENRREVLKKHGLFKLLRFLSLKPAELEEIVANVNNLLLPHEYESIKAVLNSTNLNENEIVLDSIGMINIPRNSLKLDWHFCFRSPIRSVAPIIIDSNNFAIHCRIKSNKSVFINSLCMSTRMAPVGFFQVTNIYTEHLAVYITCESNDEDIVSTNFKKTVEYDTLTDIQLTKPCYIKKDEWYTISFVWLYNRHNQHSYVAELRHKHYTGMKVSFEFDDVPFSGACSTACSGSFLAGLKYCL